MSVFDCDNFFPFYYYIGIVDDSGNKHGKSKILWYQINI